MLDVGCGDKPHWRADILVDKFLDERHAKQRNTGGSVKALAPLFESPLENLPFRDRAFDFVYCSHVLEHVADPAAAISELMRVGRQGYIEVPFVGIQKIFDQETHLWLCDRSDDALIFVAKKEAIYDSDIQRLLDAGPFAPFAFLMNFYPDAAMIRMRWTEDAPLAVKIIGAPNMDLSLPQQSSEAHGNRRTIWPHIREVLRFTNRSKLRRAPIYFNSVMKEEYRRPTDEVLTPQVYRVGR